MRPVARCGTPSGANRHRRLDEPVCDACREAKRAASREYARQPREPKPPADVAWKGSYAPGAVVIEGGWWIRRGNVLVPVGPRPVDRDHFQPNLPQPINHGTESGYSLHRRRGEPACEECQTAHRAYVKRQTARRRDAA